MEEKKPLQLLRNPDQVPDNHLLRHIISEELFDTYQTLQILLSDIGLIPEWRYYRDGKSWLCKITRKKKTIVWISVWESFIKTSFYFTEKNRNEIMRLDIDNTFKTAFFRNKATGKLIPLVLEIQNKEMLQTFRKIAEYKMAFQDSGSKNAIEL